MTDDFVQWTAIFIELIGLALIAIELYFPTLSEYLKSTFEETKPKIINNSKRWIGGFIATWVLAVLCLSLWDQSMSFIGNVIFTIITIIALLIYSLTKLAVRLGVILGRGNAVGGVGLVLAIIGLLLEVVQVMFYS